MLGGGSDPKSEREEGHWGVSEKTRQQDFTLIPVILQRRTNTNAGALSEGDMQRSKKYSHFRSLVATSI